MAAIVSPAIVSPAPIFVPAAPTAPTAPTAAATAPLILYTYTYAEVFCIRVTEDPYVRDLHFYTDMERCEYTPEQWSALGFTEKELRAFLRLHKEFRETGEKLKLTPPARPTEAALAEFASKLMRWKAYTAHWGFLHEAARKNLVKMRADFKKRLMEERVDL